MIELEFAVYDINEDAGTVDVCLDIAWPLISCPVQFPFEIQFRVSDITAGMVYSTTIIIQSGITRVSMVSAIFS